MRLSLKFLQTFRREYKRARYLEVYRRFSEFTMIPRDIYVDNLLLAERVLTISGCIVECGVWRGGMSAGLATVFGPHRNYFLFDSFQGLPAAKEIDGVAAHNWQQDKQAPGYFDNCSAELDFAERAMAQSGVKKVHLVKGWFNETLPTFSIREPIALLRLDGDWYDSTTVCLESLFQHVVPGGLIIIDDYYAWDGCSRALHDFLSRQSAVERIQSYCGICFLEKRIT